MYQDDYRPGDLPECDCRPDYDYPKNPDWLWFFDQWQKIKDRVLGVLTKKEVGPRTQDQTQPVNFDPKTGKLYTKPGTGDVTSVNGKTGPVILTAEDVGALPDSTVIPPAYELPQATGSNLGGVKASPVMPEDQTPVRADAAGFLWTSGKGSSGGDNEVVILPDKSTPVPPSAEIVVYEDEEPPKWERIEVYCPGFEALYEKPIDWESNYASYYKLEGEYTLLPVGAANYWEPGICYRKTSYVPITSFSRDKEPDGTSYHFKALMLFVHFAKVSKTVTFFAGMTAQGRGEMTFPADIPQSSTQYLYHWGVSVYPEHGYYTGLSQRSAQGQASIVTGVKNPGGRDLLPADRPLTQLNILNYDGVQIAEGSVIEIYGLR